MRSLNRAEIIGNVTRDAELRYTPQGTAIATFSVATNRSWKNESGEQKEDAEFHRVVAWSKLAELCSKFVSKGRRVFVEGRLQTREWADEAGVKHSSTEIVAHDILFLDNKQTNENREGGENV